jgi:hypothetical protein
MKNNLRKLVKHLFAILSDITFAFVASIVPHRYQRSAQRRRIFFVSKNEIRLGAYSSLSETAVILLHGWSVQADLLKN